MALLRIPLATYRLQFNAQFRFESARALVEYLERLGITDIYASPILQARHGSLHGYDVTDSSRLNDEIGSEPELEALSAKLQEHQMGLLLDIVPNHMAAVSENPWWMDVLEDGPGSAYASFFDIDWHPPRTMLQNKVLIPILGSPYAEALENQELQLVLEPSGFFIVYFEAKLPIAPKSYLQILQYRIDDLRRQLGPEHPAFRELEGICAAAINLPERVALSSEMAGERRMQREALKERLRKLYQDSTELRAFLDENVHVFNGHKRKPASFMLLDRLLADQSYVLSYWLSHNDEINYRRFFTINNLVGVRVEDPLVFEATHNVILRLVERGIVTGLRIDHVDGLRDPQGYLRRLQERAGGSPGNGHPPFYVIVEKILAPGEKLPQEWPLCGATGYASLNAINGLFLEPTGCHELRKIYRSFIGAKIEFRDLVYEKKKEVMESLLAVEMRSLGHYLVILAEHDRYARDLRRADLALALTETTACFPVYRTYVRGFSISDDERGYVEEAVESARCRNPRLGAAYFDFVNDVLLLREKVHLQPDQREARIAFVMRWQQFTGPIMAKGLEDSALYVYNPIASLNEVGGAPDASGLSISELHEFCANRHSHGHTLTATATHDTKRMEDVRTRIDVLSEIPGRWKRTLDQWSRWNAGLKTGVNGQRFPDRNAEILLYQTMLGAWPLDEVDVPAFRKRLQEYMVKAAREARIHTNWARPDLRFEKALTHFTRGILKSSQENLFLQDFLRLWQDISFFGALNSLSQLLLKITIPGVPDFYQGSELWDFRLVDPDNRGAVDFETRTRLLTELDRQDEELGRLNLVQNVLDPWQNGRIKLFLTSRALSFRRAQRELFLEGTYQSLPSTGAKKNNVYAFTRQKENAWAITVVPRLTTQLTSSGKFPSGEGVWASTALRLPADAPRDWVNILTGETVAACASGRQHVLPMAEILSKFPVALLSA